jgi:hypothetical protein
MMMLSRIKIENANKNHRQRQASFGPLMQWPGMMSVAKNIAVLHAAALATGFYRLGAAALKAPGSPRRCRAACSHPSCCRFNG